MTVGGETGLYTVNLATGAATLVDTIGNGDLAIRDLAVEIQVDDAASQYTSLASPARLVDTRLTTTSGPGKVVAGGTYSRNLGAAGDTPLTRIAGSRNQFIGAAGLAYTF